MHIWYRHRKQADAKVCHVLDAHRMGDKGRKREKGVKDRGPGRGIERNGQQHT